MTTKGHHMGGSEQQLCPSSPWSLCKWWAVSDLDPETLFEFGGDRDRGRLRWIHNARVSLSSPGGLIYSPYWDRPLSHPRPIPNPRPRPRPCPLPPVTGTEKDVEEDGSGGKGIL